MTSEFSPEIMEARKHRITFFKYRNKNNNNKNNKNHPQTLHPGKISWNGGESRHFQIKLYRICMFDI